jgi:cysteine desulfurase
MRLGRLIYLDHNATTFAHLDVIRSMEHLWGALAITPEGEHAVQRANELVRALIGVGEEGSLIWTSGATESNNLAILGTVAACPQPGPLLTTAIEHKAVLEPCRAVEARDRRYPLEFIPIDGTGLVDLDWLERRLHGPLDPGKLQRTPCLVSIGAANNEIGTVQPIGQIAKLCRAHGVPFHTDAAQAAGALPFDDLAQADLVSVSGHKLYGPRGIGALYVRGKHPLSPILFGGAQQDSLRPGTLPIPLIAGLGEAARLALEALSRGKHVETIALRTRMLGLLQEVFGSRMHLNGHPFQRLPGNLNVTFDDVDVAAVRERLKGTLRFSQGAVCSDGKPSHVLAALGLHEDATRRTARFGLGRETTENDVIEAVERFVSAARS